jgi:predicted GIY-YIG superfamily endonuclease
MIIYKVTNRINGMVYIGQTRTSLEKRWSSHRSAVNSRFSCFKLQKAIKEYGAENFTIEQIDCAATKDEANSKEMYWIKHYNSVENGYNTSPGGRNGGSYIKVMNVETGEVFNSMVEAGKAYGVSCNSIRQAVKNPTWVCCGYHWRKFS